ncbi:type I secretion system permease/ATPase [Telmatospirillum sp. J64-1]|uniref:type I secretion system permease/ATPase n=1 Tax=Telmatospirillum sp. J64-1 TaxID=2502183 RepID=UPI00115EF629|nr:type I secretion system permease/ATPase [Telmatospirillum sp. J64-1]
MSESTARPELHVVTSASALPEDPLLGCLLALSRHYDRPATPSALIAGLPLVGGRLTPALFVRAAARAGLSARVVKRPLSKLSELVLPAVVIQKDGGAVLLMRRLQDGECEVLLPETGTGTVTQSLAELEKSHSGYVILSRPECRFDDADDHARRKRPSSWFWGTLRQFWPVYGQVVMAAVLVNLLALAVPLFIMNVYDRVVPNRAVETLWVLAIGVCGAILFEFILRAFRAYFLDFAGRQADVMIASRIFEQVVGMEMSHRPQSAGGFASNLREFETLRDFFTSASLATIVDLPFIGLFLLVIWWIGGPVVLVPLAAVPLVILVGILVQVPLDRVVRRSFREASMKHGILIESISGLETIKSVGAESRVQRDWERFVGATAASGMRARNLSAFATNFAHAAQGMVTVGVVVVGVYLIAQNQLSMGALIACTILSGRMMGPLSQVTSLLTRFSQSMTALKTLNQIMALPSERPAGRQFLHRPELQGEIEFRNVSFAYPHQDGKSLEDVSFRIAPGEKVAIVGPIGCGKSTIARLILGLYRPNEGNVLIDGTDSRQIDPADLRRTFGYVPQDSFLFNGTVRENIALAYPRIDDAMILRAARIAGIHDFLRRSGQGYDLAVGERGERLSGGQRQAICIARALLTDPPVLIFDEPTSAMDQSSEERFKQRLGDSLHGKSLILVTHRPSLLSLVDRVMVMDCGRLIADGPRDAVLQALAQGRVRLSTSGGGRTATLSKG